MASRRFEYLDFGSRLCAALVLLFAGCHTTRLYVEDLPRELVKTPMPPYVLEPPDIILIDAMRVVPLPPYRIEPLDSLFVQATNTLPTDPIAGIYSVEPDGVINFGVAYGSVRVADLTLEEAKTTIEERLKKVLKEPQVTVALSQSRANQQIRGEHLIGPDGTVNLGLYGSVYVAGKTLAQAKVAIEQHLSKYLYKPEVAVDVFAYNSKVYYIVTDGAGYGEQVYRMPITGNETILDAISQINGLPAVASKTGVWISRPAPAGQNPYEKLPVDWKGITHCGLTATNYQVMPGDRIYVMAQPIITIDTVLARMIAPVERVFGITLLGTSTIRSIQNPNFGSGSNSGF